MPRGRQSAESSAALFLPQERSLANLTHAAAACQGCELYKAATQTVFGEGNPRARAVFVGEQPGDSEDKAGKPFVGPAGKLLSKALESAGINQQECYITNAVKHFKFEWRGKRRLHQKPRRIEVEACYPWLEAELHEIKPEIIICLGATAAQALLGRDFRLTKHRGEFMRHATGAWITATIHPSAILRAPDSATREQELRLLIDDLTLVAALLEQGTPPQAD